jgi:hypothetical protein
VEGPVALLPRELCFPTIAISDESAEFGLKRKQKEKKTDY